jgi:hypothetical protein
MIMNFTKDTEQANAVSLTSEQCTQDCLGEQWQLQDVFKAQQQHSALISGLY